MQRLASSLAAIAIVLGGVQNAAAAKVNTGRISLVHLNADVAGRGTCIQMVPALGTTWACLATTSPLYKEITSMVFMAYMTGQSCTVHISDLPNPAFNQPDIRVVQCA